MTIPTCSGPRTADAAVCRPAATGGPSRPRRTTVVLLAARTVAASRRGAPAAGSISRMTASNDSAPPRRSSRRRARSPGRSSRCRSCSTATTARPATRCALAVGRRPAKDVEVVRWHECATAAAVISTVDHERFDILVLDGEAAKVGGLGLARQLKNEIFDCPPIIVLTGRPQDAGSRPGRRPTSPCRTRSTRSRWRAPCRRWRRSGVPAGLTRWRRGPRRRTPGPTSSPAHRR